ncbi:NAD(P)-binding protein [Polyporus arcularius HHB13444]|uniref:NAD(P)-binding protein n=1 Tax=Polyporus arcularius HHB13444 TaxID=1314778 RepID=A0A5C3PYY1_9APHY|nr:NAD(P)-binding protein [Polyporus arcularius HHB13444]
MDSLSAALSSVKGSAARYPLLVTLMALFVTKRLWRLKLRRSRTLPRGQERVLVVGASSGIGRAIAHEYAAAGALVCIVGRRENELKVVAEECANRLPKAAAVGSSDRRDRLLALPGDFCKAEDMLAVRDSLEEKWGGVDTLIICAGVSALRPLLEVAGLEKVGGVFVPPKVDASGVQRTVAAANAAMQGNYIGPLVCAVTFIPFLSATSRAPAILLVSSLAAVVPAPTRSLYTSSKASSLLLYQSLAIEHPSIAFSYIIPATVEGDFRASAVDGGLVREADPNRHGLKRTVVAKRCIDMIDHGEKAAFMPAWYGRVGHFGYWLAPSIIEWLAGRKYNFAAK